MLAACGVTEDVEIAEVTETAATEVAETPAETAGEETKPETESEEPEFSPVEPGYYLVSSVGKNGDVTFFATMDAANGYLKLNEDGTGTMYFDGVEAELTWDEEAIYWQGQALPCVTVGYYDDELGREDSMLMLYFLDSMTSVILRPAEEPAA